MSIGEKETDIKTSIFRTNDGRRRRGKNRKEKVTITSLGIGHSNFWRRPLWRNVQVDYASIVRDPQAPGHALLVCREYSKENKIDDGWVEESGNGRGRK